MAAGATLRESVVSTNGVDVFVRERGEGHPLLMINGLGANLEMWGASEERLSAVARTIVFDLPGTGRSTTPLWPQSIPVSARIVSDVLDELGYGRVDVLGFSLGGLVAQQLARDAQARIRRIALAGTAVGWGSMPGTLHALALIAMPLRFYSRGFYEQTNSLLSKPDNALVRRSPKLTDARLRYPPSLLGYAGQLWAGSVWSSLAWLQSVRVPTLVLHGDGDELVPPANGVQLARLLPDSRLHVLPARDTSSYSIPTAGRSRCSRTSSRAEPSAAPARGRREPWSTTTGRSRPPSRTRSARSPIVR